MRAAGTDYQQRTRGAQGSATTHDLTALRMLRQEHSHGDTLEKTRRMFLLPLSPRLISNSLYRPTGDMATSVTKARNGSERRAPPRLAGTCQTVFPKVCFSCDRLSFANPGLESGDQKCGPIQITSYANASFLSSKAGCMFSSSSLPKEVLRIHHDAVDQTITDLAAFHSMGEPSTYEGSLGWLCGP